MHFAVKWFYNIRTIFILLFIGIIQNKNTFTALCYKVF
jgi:hypothetical protein